MGTNSTGDVHISFEQFPKKLIYWHDTEFYIVQNAQEAGISPPRKTTSKTNETQFYFLTGAAVPAFRLKTR